MVPGERDVTRVNPYRSGISLVRTLSSSGGYQVSGGDSRSASFPADDIHQVRITEGDGGMTLGEDKQRDRLGNSPTLDRYVILPHSYLQIIPPLATNPPKALLQVHLTHNPLNSAHPVC